VNPDELAALCERVANAETPTETPEIRLCCPRGHFIAAVSPYIEEADGRSTLGMARAEGRYQHWASARGPRPNNPGWTLTTTPRGKSVTLSCRRCPRWTLTRDYQRFAVELAVHALAGHREYRL
jgi:hypothetical protein